MSVYSVNVYPSSTTIRTGNWYYGAYAVVNASSNCNTGVRWYSNNTSIATVNASSGYIYAKAPGTTRIYAQSTVDSSKKDYITVTVTSGTIKKGNAIIGFKTSGSPKITGSFTLKIPGRKLSFPRDFRRFDLHLNAMIKARETVLPVPPRKIIRLAKSCVAIYGLTASAAV